jgi:hypothetical protein
MHKNRNVSPAKLRASAGSLRKKEKRTYSAPFILSSEPLEAVAAVCDGKGAQGPGKELGPFGGCGTLGS